MDGPVDGPVDGPGRPREEPELDEVPEMTVVRTWGELVRLGGPDSLRARSKLATRRSFVVPSSEGRTPVHAAMGVDPAILADVRVWPVGAGTRAAVGTTGLKRVRTVREPLVDDVAGETRT